MIKPNPPPRGVGFVWELRSLGISSNFWLNLCLITPTEKTARKKLAIASTRKKKFIIQVTLTLTLNHALALQQRYFLSNSFCKASGRIVKVFFSGFMVKYFIFIQSQDLLRTNWHFQTEGFPQLNQTDKLVD